MKKTLFILLVAMCSTVAMAEDIVTTQSGSAESSLVYDYGEVNMYQFENLPLRYQGGSVYHYGKKLDANGYANLLRNNTRALEQFERGLHLKKAGWWTFAGGMVFSLVVGIPVDATTGLGLFTPLFTCATLGASIPMICIGNKHIKQSVNTYNGVSSEISWNITAGESGIGLAMNF